MEYSVSKVRSYFPPFVIRLSIITSIAIFAILIFITNTAAKAHSDSEVDYRQESIFKGVEFSTNTNVLVDNNVYKTHKIAFSYTVDKVTPTPIPAQSFEDNDIWIQLAQCESKQNWSIDTGNGYYGGLQFSQGAWSSVGGIGKPSEASKEEQIEKGKQLQAKRGWGVWGACAKKLGLN